MTWLSGWLREVIMIVILASFIDLLLPSRSMERYVKLVMSLLILLTLLGPLIKLLTDSPASQLSAAISKQDQESIWTAKGAKGNLNQILVEASKIKLQQQAQTLKFAGEEVAQRMKEQIQQQTGQKVEEVKVALSLQPVNQTSSDQESPVISAVIVILPGAQASGSTGNQQQGLGQSIAIEAIQPVQVDVQVQPEEGSSVAASTSQPDNSQSQSEAAQTEGTDIVEKSNTIRDMLVTMWDLKPESVTVQRKAE
ncbi:stage III sporulation protein AF [Paenibacillus pini]|uniref:Stage III sporulation protein AF n=1 Tax=Paenibacillus pini JCM 16418 TaxID=1236976 RepID=W7YK92_9BACL|nr:stage III sporulation protein AF [Paenibacillus pini]GAF08932.1 stage III sporulation protein AF [Paenibacillus pini JCM 16418]